MSENNAYQARALKERGFRRCQRHWPRGWTPVGKEEFTDAEWDRLNSEPMLEVRVSPPTGEEAAAQAEADAKAKAEADAQAPAPPVLGPYLADGITPRCQHVFDGGGQCTRRAAEGSEYCEGHMDDHQDGGGE